MEKELNTKQTKELYEAILKLKCEDDCKRFFRDLCTLTELTAMTERFQVAKKVYKNVPYRKVAQETGSSTATITRVAHWLNHGMGGYKIVLERLHF